MTRRRLAPVALAVAAIVAFVGCSGSDSTSSKPSGSSTTASTKPPKPVEAWVAKWRGTVAEQYGPAQEAFLAAVQGAKVVDVQAAARQLGAATQAVLDAIRAAGQAPDEGRDAADRLETALETERALIEEILRVCTGADTSCQKMVTQYGANNSKEIVPALVALGL